MPAPQGEGVENLAQDTTQAKPGFCAVLSPPHALSQRGFLVLMAAIAGLSFAIGFNFWMMGAWPVTGFLGLDVALVYLAFRAYRRAARAREIVEIADDTLHVRRLAPDGARRDHAFNPYWVRTSLDEFPDGSNELALVSHGKRFIIARFLGAEERREFCDALNTALAAHKA